ncbi:MAG: hypothetical protein OEP48_04645 [Betaproteobacteria bacterium]|nr:hypothetical protein [Betaproteobacteria bacterium]MDH3435843.1 hypothetical protein [Betaproteobacteria bacterium]
MLQWLSSLGKKADHPMYNVEEARRLLGGVSADDSKALEEISSYLEGITATPDFPLADRIGVLKLVDETGQPLAGAALNLFMRSTTLKEFERRALWQQLTDFSRSVSAAYRLCLQEIAQARKPDAPAHPEHHLLIARTLRALAAEGKMLQMRYLPVRPRVWEELAALYADAENEHYVGEIIKAYPTDLLPTNVRQEFLRLLMMDVAAPNSQSLGELELSARVVARMAAGFALHATPEKGCPFCFDLAHPGRPSRHTPDAKESPTLRYFGVGRSGGEMREIIERHTANPVEPEKRFGNDFSVGEKLVVLKRLLRYWGDGQPEPQTPRVKIDAKIKVSHGFSAASELITRIEFSGMGEMSDDMRMRVKQRTGIALQAHEITAQIDEWQERDATAWSIGADVPRQHEAWAKIGALCAVVPPGMKSWWLSVIRRMRRDEQDHMHTEIEIVSKKPLSVYLRGIGEGAEKAENWQTSSGSFEFTFVNALILNESAVANTSHEILLKRETFNPGIIYEVLMGDPPPYVRLEELLERGEDYDRVRVTWLKGEPASTPAA